MDEEYRAIYNSIYEAWIGTRFFLTARGVPLASAAVASAIESVDAEMEEREGVRCRSDAKVLLLINFVQMVTIPVRVLRRAAANELNQAIAEDIRLILMEANRDDRREISAHAVIDSLSRNWRSLRVSHFRIWE